MRADARNLSTAPADLTPPGGPALAPAGGGLPVVVMTAGSRVPHSKSFGSFIRSYGRGKGLSIAAPCTNMPGALTPGLGHVESSSCWRKRDDQDYGQEELLR